MGVLDKAKENFVERREALKSEVVNNYTEKADEVYGYPGINQGPLRRAQDEYDENDRYVNIEEKVVAGPEIKDSEWVRQVMFIPRIEPQSAFKNARATHILRNRQYTDGVVNFADTTLGGNRSINPRPQFTEFADQNVDTLLASVNNQLNIPYASRTNLHTGGMGRYYAESIDNFAQRIYMDFGVPSYNSLGNFFSRFYDYEQGRMANTGVVNDALYTAGKVLGFTFLLPVNIMIRGLTTITSTIADVVKFILRIPTTRYYYMKPTMDLYWAMVTTIVNHMSVNMGLIPGYDPQDYYPSDKKVEDSLKPENAKTAGATSIKVPSISQQDFEKWQQILPDIFRNNNGGIDPRAVATRYQRLANAHQKAMENLVAEGKGSMADIYEGIIRAVKQKEEFKNQPLDQRSMDNYITEYMKSAVGRGFRLIDITLPLKDENQKAAVEAALSGEGDSLDQQQLKGVLSAASSAGTTAEEEGTSDEWKAAKAAYDEASSNANSGASLNQIAADGKAEGSMGSPKGSTTIQEIIAEHKAFYEGTVRDGAAWVSFVVDNVGTMSESWSSSTRSSSIAEAMNQKSSEARNMIFNLAGGNIGVNPIASVVEATIGGVKSVINGIANSFGLSGLSALGGAAFADIPDFWDGSTTSMPTSSYTIKLRSPYGNPMSLLINVYFPLAMLLAAAVPRSTGPNSYTSPFLCRLWHKGRNQVGLGIISDLSITRGVGTAGWNLRDQATDIDVTFTVQNLSQMMHMPISPEVGLMDSIGAGAFNEANNYTDYMAVLAGLGLPEQYYHFPNLKRQHILSMTNWDTWYSLTNFNMKIVHGTLPGQLMNAIARDAAFF